MAIVTCDLEKQQHTRAITYYGNIDRGESGCDQDYHVRRPEETLPLPNRPSRILRCRPSGLSYRSRANKRTSYIVISERIATLSKGLYYYPSESLANFLHQRLGPLISSILNKTLLLSRSSNSSCLAMLARYADTLILWTILISLILSIFVCFNRR
jgi:hypothetical protein